MNRPHGVNADGMCMIDRTEAAAAPADNASRDRRLLSGYVEETAPLAFMAKIGGNIMKIPISGNGAPLASGQSLEWEGDSGAGFAVIHRGPRISEAADVQKDASRSFFRA